MDVTCERCSTEYEFDETLVSDRGTTVKCTNCGHLFKVFRPGSDDAPRTWTVRRLDGSTETLTSLKDLQRLITSGSLSPEDWITGGDEPEKRLGEIAELSTFFAAAAHAAAEVVPERRPRRRTDPAGSSPRPDSVEPPPQRSRGAPAPTRTGFAGDEDLPFGSAEPNDYDTEVDGQPAEIDAPSERAGSSPAPRSEPPAQRRPSTRPNRSAEMPGATQTAEEISIPGPARVPSAPPFGIESDLPPLPRGKSRSGLWVLLILFLAAAVGVALAWPNIAPSLGLADEPSPTSPHLAEGDAMLAADTTDDYPRAVHHYTQALAFDARDTEVLVRLARAHALWAQAIRFDADDLEGRADDDPTLRGEANALRREERRHAETALARAEDAVRHGAGDESAEAALADALRLTNDLTRSRSRLERALTLAASPSSETLRVRALLEAAEHEGDLTYARTYAEQAVAEQPDSIRARLTYARALLAASDVSAARSQIDAVLRRSERHPRARALQAAISEGQPPAPATVAVGDGGTAAVEPRPAPPAAEDTSTTGGAAASTTPDSPRSRTPTAGGESQGRNGGGSGVPAGRTYDFYVYRGDELLENNNARAARDFYEAARRIRSGGSEALTGLGYVALETGDTSGAAARFRQAAAQGYAEAYIGLGSAYRRLGRTQDALAAYERYLERLPSGRSASIARRQAEDLRAQLGANEAAAPPSTAAPPSDTPSETTSDTPDETPTPAPDPPPSPAPAAPEPAPSTEPGTLPAPRGMEEPPPEDTPTVGSEP